MNVNGHDKNGQTPLMLASKNKNSAIAKLLIDAGADVNIRRKNSKTPLMMAPE